MWRTPYRARSGAGDPPPTDRCSLATSAGSADPDRSVPADRIVPLCGPAVAWDDAAMPKSSRRLRTPFVAVTLATVGAAACANEGTVPQPTSDRTATQGTTSPSSGTATASGTAAPDGTTTTAGTGSPTGTGAAPDGTAAEGQQLADGSLPNWDDVPSKHPEGATNPPAPVLNVTRDGSRCFKTFEGGMVRPQGVFNLTIGEASYLVRYVDGPQGKQIGCPKDLKAALEARNKKGAPPAK
jgi:hypothetical protein